MRKTISVVALLLALTCPAYAGDIQNDSPKPQTSTVQAPTDGEVTTVGEVTGETPEDTADALARVMLDLLAALPSLF